MSTLQELYAWMATSPDGRNGIASLKVTDDVWLPLVTDRRDQADQYKPVAQHLASLTGKPVTLVRFGNPEVLDTIPPA